MWELDHKEDWVLKNWFPQTVMLDKSSRVPWTTMRFNQSILKEINPEYSLEWLMLKLKLQYNTLASWCDEELTDWKGPWWWERLKAKEDEGSRGWGGLITSSTQWTWIWANSGRKWRMGSLVRYSPWDREELDTTWQLNKANKLKSYD